MSSCTNASSASQPSTWQNPGNAMRRYFDAWVPTEVRVRVRVWVGDSIREPRFEIAGSRINATRPLRQSKYSP